MKLDIFLVWGCFEDHLCSGQSLPFFSRLKYRLFKGKIANEAKTSSQHLIMGPGNGSFLGFPAVALRSLLTFTFRVFCDRCFEVDFLKINFSFLFASLGIVVCKLLSHGQEHFFFSLSQFSWFLCYPEWLKNTSY